jgi:hypothetical protein
MSTILPNAVQTYIDQSKQVIATPNQTMIEVMNIISAHTADVFVKVLQILSSKYGHSVDDMLNVIRTHPDYHNICVPPVITPEFYTKVQPTPPIKKPRGRPKKIIVTPVTVPVVNQISVCTPPIVQVIHTHIPGEEQRQTQAQAQAQAQAQQIEAQQINTPSLSEADTCVADPCVADPCVADPCVADPDKISITPTQRSVEIVKKKVYRIKPKTESLDRYINSGVDTKEVIPHSY